MSRGTIRTAAHFCSNISNLYNIRPGVAINRIIFDSHCIIDCGRSAAHQKLNQLHRELDCTILCIVIAVLWLKGIGNCSASVLRQLCKLCLQRFISSICSVIIGVSERSLNTVSLRIRKLRFNKVSRSRTNILLFIYSHNAVPGRNLQCITCKCNGIIGIFLLCKSSLQDAVASDALTVLTLQSAR